MCYYNGIKVSRLEYIRLKDLEASIKHMQALMKPLVDGFDFGNTIVLRASDDGSTIVADQMEWGFIPSYNKTSEEVTKMRRGYMGTKGFITPKPNLNAKSENLFMNEERTRTSIFADAARNHRCLVLSTGFYEWRHLPRLGKKGQELKTKDAFPYHIELKDREYFYMAGVWQPWTDQQTGETVNTVAIVTTEANPLMKEIHNKDNKWRMPTILPDDLGEEWILGNLSDERIYEIAHYQYPWQQMEACTVDKSFKEIEEPFKHVPYPQVPAISLTKKR